MALGTGAFMDALKTLVLTVEGVKSVTFGFPSAPTAALAAWITTGGRGTGRDDRDYGGHVRREARFVVWFAMTVGSAPSAVERALAEAVDDFEEKMYAARTVAPASVFSGTCEAVRVDFTLADNPDYVLFSGTERRVYPVGVSAVQSHQAAV